MRVSTNFGWCFLLALLLPVRLRAQSEVTAAYFPAGTTYELTTTDGQLRPTGRLVLQVRPEATSAQPPQTVLRQQIFDVEGRLMAEAELPGRRPLGGTVLLDVRTFVNAQLLHALQLGDLRAEADSLAALPTAATALGTMLPDGNLTLTGRSGQNPRGVQFTLFGRHVTATELVATPAGTFECQRLTQHLRIESFVAGTRRCYNLRLLTWMAPGAGLVRTETYAGDALFDTTVLSRIVPASATPPPAMVSER